MIADRYRSSSDGRIAIFDKGGYLRRHLAEYLSPSELAIWRAYHLLLKDPSKNEEARRILSIAFHKIADWIERIPEGPDILPTLLGGWRCEIVCG